ncbi:MAG: aminotransferase class V-fold PLP-dependent enzyme, partial [Betaproteobacteria bacterium]
SDIALQIEAQLHGGGHERGLRSGTLPTHQIVGMGESYELAKALMTSENTRIRIQRDRLLKHLMALDGVELNGDLEHRIPHNINISIDNCALDLNTLTAVALSSASACLGGQSSHVINAMKGHSDTQSTLMRISLGRFNTDTEIDFVADYLEDQIRRCRQGKD